MLQSLISLSDEDIDIVTDAVQSWCSEKKYTIDSDEGRHALTVAIDLIQVSPMRDDFARRLISKLNNDVR